MDKQTERARAQERADRQQDQPTWRKTTPRGNPEIDRADMERSTERMEMLLGH